MDRSVAGTAPTTHARFPRRIGRAIAWLVLGAVCVHFLLTVYGKYQHLDADAYAMFWSRRGWLWTHLAGGAFALVLGPLQLLTRWSRTRPSLHRWTGRTYMTGILIACVGATGLIATSPAPFPIRAAFAATALAWLATALAALLAIRRGRVPRHRRMMIRNYLVTLAPVTFRMLLPALMTIGLAPSPTMIATLLWLSWLLPLLACEAVFRIADLLRATQAQRTRMGGTPVARNIDPEATQVR